MQIEPNLKMRKAMFWFVAFFFLCFASLILRLFWIQIVKGPWYSTRALEQQTKDRVITSKRGKILDRNGAVLAESISAETVSVTPNQIAENAKKGISVDSIATNLAQILELDKADVYKKLTKKSFYEIIKRKIDKPVADSIRKYINQYHIIGIKIDEDTKRYYPNGSLAAQVIGFVGTDNDGLEGIEAILNNQLKGQNGRIISAQNIAGVDMPFDYEKLVNPTNGVNAELTIDETIQHFVENHLEKAYIDNKLENGAACIVMNVKTGEILAMATMPTYNLNKPFEVTNTSFLDSIKGLDEKAQAKAKNDYLTKIRRNKGVVDTYEPGSVFKIFTASMALEENDVKLTDRFFCSGSVRVADRKISCWKSGGHGSEDFVQGVLNSCNPVFVALGERIGSTAFNKYYNGFGFTQKTGIELMGEAVGAHYTKYSKLDLACAAFGQTNNVTPIQMVTGIAAIANDGKYMKPHIIKRLVDDDGNIIQEKQPEMLRQIVSKETSDTMKSILEKNVEEGTASNAYVAGFRIAGKTGTSEKQPRGQGKYIASFGCFAPADDPEIACIVILDQPPRGATYYGGQIAAPVAGKIMSDILSYLGTATKYTEGELALIENPVPDVNNMNINEAKALLTKENFKYKIIGDGTTVLNQVPKPDIKVNANSTVTLYTSNNDTQKTVKVPKILGMTLSQTQKTLTNAGLNMKITGVASAKSSSAITAQSQSIKPGTKVPYSTVITVEFRAKNISD